MKNRYINYFSNVDNSYQIVYIDYSVRLIGQFFIFSILVKHISKEDFADYAFYSMISTYITSVINSSLDALINNKLSSEKKDVNEYYEQSLKFKILEYFLFSCLICWLMKILWENYYLYFIIGFIGITIEHLDIKARFLNNYKSIIYRLPLGVLFLTLKIIFSIFGSILGILTLGIIESLMAFFITLSIIKTQIYFGGEIKFIRDNILSIIKTSIGGLLTFTFLQLDQFLSYKFLGKEIYAGYAVICRFYLPMNAIVGIYSRYLIPKIYQNKLSYKTVLKKIASNNFLVSILVCFACYIYLKFWLLDYKSNFSVIIILSISSFALIFGQIRGIYFIRNNDLMPDIFNAIIGILSFVVVFLSYHIESAENIAICYMIGAYISGMLTTLLYKNGWRYLYILSR